MFSCTNFDNLVAFDKFGLPLFSEGWKSGDVNKKTRCIIVDWLYQTSVCIKSNKQIIDLTIFLFDSYVIENKVSKNQIQLVSLACLLIANKKLKIFPIEIKTISHLAYNKYTKEEIIKTESKIFEYLNGFIDFPMVCEYLRYISVLASSDSETHSLAGVLVRVMYYDCIYSHFSPSIIATSAHMIASNMNGLTCFNPFSCLLEDISECCFYMKNILMTMKLSSLNFFSSLVFSFFLMDNSSLCKA